MRKYHRPDQEKMEKLLEDNCSTLTGVVLRLAWLEGLSRLEMQSLTWDMVDYGASVIRLPDREVPLEGDTGPCLRQWRIVLGEDIEYVIVSDTRIAKTPLAVESISRIARIALDSEGMTDIRLHDLRHDYVRRQLELHDRQYVLRVAGYAVTTYHQYEMSKELPDDIPKRHKEADPLGDPAAVEKLIGRLQTIMEKDKESAAGIALWLSVHLGIGIRQITELTWDAVDFQENTVCVGGELRPLPGTLCAVLQEARLHRREGEDPHVILSPRSRKPMREERLSVVLRTLLTQGGIDIPLSSLWKLMETQFIENRILALAREHGSISNYEVTQDLGISYAAVRWRLEQLEQQGKLVRVENRYYPADAVIRQEDYEDVIVKRLAAQGAASSDAIAAWLHIGRRRCKKLMDEMVKAGRLNYLRSEKQYSVKEQCQL